MPSQDLLGTCSRETASRFEYKYPCQWRTVAGRRRGPFREDKWADGGPNPTRRCWVFHEVFSQKLSLSVSIVINDKAGVKINLLPVWFLAGSVRNSVVNLEGNAELTGIWKLGLSREESKWGARGAPESRRPQFLTLHPLLSCVYLIRRKCAEPASPRVHKSE